MAKENGAGQSLPSYFLAFCLAHLARCASAIRLRASGESTRLRRLNPVDDWPLDCVVAIDSRALIAAVKTPLFIVLPGQNGNAAQEGAELQRLETSLIQVPLCVKSAGFLALRR